MYQEERCRLAGGKEPEGGPAPVQSAGPAHAEERLHPGIGQDCLLVWGPESVIISC